MVKMGNCLQFYYKGLIISPIKIFIKNQLASIKWEAKSNPISIWFQRPQSPRQSTKDLIVSSATFNCLQTTRISIFYQGSFVFTIYQKVGGQLASKQAVDKVHSHLRLIMGPSCTNTFEEIRIRSINVLVVSPRPKTKIFVEALTSFFKEKVYSLLLTR